MSNRYHSKMLGFAPKRATGEPKRALTKLVHALEAIGAEPVKPKGYDKMSRVEKRALGLLDRHNNPIV